MIAYLLHQMPDADREAFAERWFSEPELYERLQMVEAELLDDCARGKVSRSQRRRIERYLLGSESQRRKFTFAAALQAALPSPKTLRMPWGAIVAAALVASLGISLWLGLLNRTLRTEIAQLQHAPQPVSENIYTIGLPRDTLRGGSTENTVRLPMDVRLVRVELELLPGEEKNAYSATLLRDNRALWSEGPLHAEVRGRVSVITIWVPGALLGPGEHSLRLDAPGNPIGYDFTVTR